MTDRLRQAIRESGLPMLTLANESGVERVSLLRFARGDQSLRLDIADKLAVYFGLDLQPTQPTTVKEKKTTGNAPTCRTYTDNPRRLVPRQRIFLVLSCAANDDHFAAVFLETWERLPVAARKRIAAAAKRDRAGLLVAVMPDLPQDRQGEAAAGSLLVQFSVELVDLWPKPSLQRIIAHELAHIYDNLDGNKPLTESEAELERRVNAITDTWGFLRDWQVPDADDGARMKRNLTNAKTKGR
jgi:transcriptional regulator with XRE-family HTH domain